MIPKEFEGKELAPDRKIAYFTTENEKRLHLHFSNKRFACK